MCLLFETIRIEGGVVHFLEHHQSRVDRSIGAGIVDLACYVLTLILPKNGCHKLRMVYDESGILKHEILSYQVCDIKSLRVVDGGEIDYSSKFENRSSIERLRGLRGCCDDIIIAKNGVFCDSSFANLAFFDGRKWVTPATPLLRGTCMERLIFTGVLVEKNIKIEDVMRYQKVVLINAMLGFEEGRAIVISKASIVF